MRIRTKRFTKLPFVIAGIAVLAGAAVFTLTRQQVEPAQAYKNQTVSPVPADMIDESTAQPLSANKNVIRHVIKREDSSNIDTIQMAAYFDSRGANAAHRIRIDDRDTDPQRCHAFLGPDTRPNNNNTIGANATFITVTLRIEAPSSVPAANKVITYPIKSTRVCTNPRSGGINGRATTGKARNNIANNTFFGWYDVPVGFNQALPDQSGDTGLYKVHITIKYAADVPYGETGSSSSEKQQVTFRVKINDGGCGAQATSTCTRYLSTVQTDTQNSARNYSTLGENKDGAGYYTGQYFKFGLPCKQREVASKSVIVYDSDNGTKWWNNQVRRVTVRVQRFNKSINDWQTLIFDHNGNANNPRVVRNYSVQGAKGFQNGDTDFVPVDQDEANLKITFDMDPDTNYQLYVYHVYTRNLIGIGLPTETIFGEISCNYSLNPGIAVNSASVTQGVPVSVSGNINNSGDVISYGNSRANVVRFVLPAGSSLDYNSSGSRRLGNNTNFACQLASHVASSMRNCASLYTTARNFPVGTTTLWTGTDALSGVPLDAGDQVCYMTIVNLYNQPADALDWRYSAPICRNVIKKPSIQVWGNDVRVGSPFVGGTGVNASVIGSMGQYGSDIRGSWGEYGVFAPNGTAASTVVNFASGAGINNSAATVSPATWSNLTFSNADMARLGWFGPASAMGEIPDVRTAILAAAPRAGLTIDNGDTTVSSYRPNHVIVTNGTVRITGNIEGPDSVANEGGLSQMVIIANSILIDHDVTRVDAWLIASGSSPSGVVNTCGDRTTPMVASACDDELEITGPVMARALLARRTGGTDGDPAEIVNLRGDAYVWAYRIAAANSSLTTVYSQELPPRF